MTTELTAGPELDKAVAEAIGAEFREGIWWYGDKWPRINLGPASDERVLDGIYDDETSGMFSPSTDLNDAFFAAEKVGIFRRWINPDSAPPEWDIAPGYEEVRFLTQNRNWEVCQWCDGVTGGDYETISTAPTPELAICRAILTLKNRD